MSHYLIPNLRKMKKMGFCAGVQMCGHGCICTGCSAQMCVFGGCIWAGTHTHIHGYMWMRRISTEAFRYGAFGKILLSRRVQFKMSHLFWVSPSRLSAGCINGKFQIPLLTWLQCTDNQEITPNRYLPKAVL
jgi:hypothetical protein